MLENEEIQSKNRQKAQTIPLPQIEVSENGKSIPQRSRQRRIFPKNMGARLQAASSFLQPPASRNAVARLTCETPPPSCERG